MPPRHLDPKYQHHADIYTPSPPPRSLQRSDTAHSRYVQMLLDIDHIPILHSILASFFVWLLLAGFLVFPGTFTTIQRSIESKHAQQPTDQATDLILKSVKNIPLLVIAAVACGLSITGMAVLAVRHAQNYVWMLNKLIMPGVANCLAGLISTLVGVYSQQHGVWSVTAKVTAIVEGACLGVAGALFLIFEYVLLKRVRDHHGRFYGDGMSNASSVSYGSDVSRAKSKKTASEF
ncbi:hypothetical protein E4U09_003186 [Claviceps aff. purpurea]|uniref:Uncharacterized protein n=1 Tax=Claviceps aff. purpurea TaxID=1967640 RepID=A0A9P7U0K6_9HYPO|nr:hypothetical protein E4U09_003186 [Claviceps aff. purpurea]